MVRPAKYANQGAYVAERRRKAAEAAARRIATRGSVNAAVINFSIVNESIERSIADGVWGKDLTRKLNNLMRNMEKASKGGSDRGMATANKQLANTARRAALAAYMTRVKGGATYAGRDAPGRRMTGGLERALRSTRIARGDTSGAYLWNTNVLWEYAHHWARLNYGAKSTSGAAPRGGFSPDQLKVDLSGFTRRGYQTLPSSGLVASKLVYDGGRQRAGFRVPSYAEGAEPKNLVYGFTRKDIRGKMLFLKEGGTQKMAIKFRKGPIPTRGIEGRFFLEAGTSAALATVGEAYGPLPKQWFLKAKRSLK
jgi:hypothetical protein